MNRVYPVVPVYLVLCLLAFAIFYAVLSCALGLFGVLLSIPVGLRLLRLAEQADLERAIEARCRKYVGDLTGTGIYFHGVRVGPDGVAVELKGTITPAAPISRVQIDLKVEDHD